jgi:hypothetical protein
MFKLNFSILEGLSQEESIEDLNQVFINLLNQLKNMLNLDLINSNVKIVYNEDEKGMNLDEINVLDQGVSRIFQEDFLIIEINKEFKKFLPILLLREAYYCFVPDSLKEIKGIKIIINQIVEINLQKFEVINQWKLLIRNYIVDYEFLTSEFDRLEKFFKLKETESTESSVRFFFEYIRKNYLLISDEIEDFHDSILKKFILKTSKSIYNDEMVENLRILIKIFYKVKSYRALLDYQNYFKKYKEDNIIKTNLSLRKFTSNIKWLNEFSFIAPSYKIIWNTIGLRAVYCCIRFNPILSNTKIDRIIEKMPFFLMSKSSESYFAKEFTCWFIIPSLYLDDLRNLYVKLENMGYIIKKHLITYSLKENFLNLNYFRNFYRKGRLINPDHSKYDSKYEINFEMELSENNPILSLSLLDYLILNRVGYYSMDGLSFERRIKTLEIIKSDLLYEILNQRSQIRKLKKSLKIFQNNSKLKQKFLNLIENNPKFGFFYLNEFIGNLVLFMKALKRFIAKNPSIKNVYQFKEILEKNAFSTNFNENLLLNDKYLMKVIFNEILPLYFKDLNDFEVELKTFQTFSKFLHSCYALKVFDLKAIIKIVKSKKIINEVFSVKEKKLKEIYENNKLQTITSYDIEDVLDNLLNNNPPAIKPLLINSINTTNFAKYFIEVIIKDNFKTRQILSKIKKFFPRVVQSLGRDLFSNDKLNIVEIYIPNLKEREKRVFISTMLNLFSGNIIRLKRYYYDGFQVSSRAKDYYDLEKKEFFYTKDLFKQYLNYIQVIFGEKLKSYIEPHERYENFFWSPKKNFKKLIEIVDDRLTREQKEFDNNKLNNLGEFFVELRQNLINPEKLKIMKKEPFFKKYVKSIKFKPVYQNFGIGEYYLYIRPRTLKKIDFKILLNNTFRKIRYPAFIDNTQSLFIKYLFPYRNPNISYLNWLMKSKQIINEFCLFFVKKIYFLFHFDQNISSNGWNLEASDFKAFIKKVLFNFNFYKKLPKLKSYNVGDLKLSNYLEPSSKFFKNLIEITGWKTLDIKSILGTRNYSLIKKIVSLIEKDKIISYIKLKNLDFQEKIYIILPNINKELNDPLVKIFNWFPYGFIYEIEGEYFIHGIQEKIKFENGLMIKLYLPLTEFSHFQGIFDLLFQFLKIEKYLILYDMIDGKNLLKHVYGNLSFLDTYNPLKNLKWNDKDKIWMNHKLFNEKFEPIYPNLIPNEEK